MYKKLVVLLCSIIFLVTGCINQKTVDMTEEKKATDEIVETFTPEPEITSVYPSEFNKNDTLSFPGNFEITLTTSEFKTRVDPTNPGDFHTYYEVKSTETVYMHIAIEVKNLKGSGFFADEVASFKLIYDGKYEYTAFSAIEESGGGDFTYTNITFLQPLITRKIHYLIEVPLEVRDSGKDYKIVMYANGNEYEYIQEQGEGTVVQMADEKPLQTDYQLDTYKPLDAETINIISDYGEFTLKSATLTTKVTPTSPSGFYTYYQVKNPDNIYLDVVIEFKNLMTTSKSADEIMTVKALFDNTYEYKGFNTVESDNGQDFDYSNLTSIEPLTSCLMHYIIEMPNTVEQEDKALSILITVDGNDYVYSVR